VVVGVVGETGSEEGLMRRTILRHAFVILTVAGWDRGEGKRSRGRGAVEG
jgi:hypothetical protein